MKPTLETTEFLSCQLTDSEVGIYSTELSALVLGIEELQDEAKNAAADYRDQIKVRKERQGGIARKLRSRSEVREVRCQLAPNLESGSVDVIRLDTGEVALSREMTAEEERLFRQQILDLERRRVPSILPDPEEELEVS